MITGSTAVWSRLNSSRCVRWDGRRDLPQHEQTWNHTLDQKELHNGGLGSCIYTLNITFPRKRSVWYVVEILHKSTKFAHLVSLPNFVELFWLSLHWKWHRYVAACLVRALVYSKQKSGSWFIDETSISGNKMERNRCVTINALTTTTRHHARNVIVIERITRYPSLLLLSWTTWPRWSRLDIIAF